MSTIAPVPAAGPIPGLADLVRGLNQVNVTADSIGTFVATIVKTWNGFTNQSVSLLEVAALIEQVLRENKEYGDAEVLRLRALIAAQLIADEVVKQ